MVTSKLKFKKNDRVICVAFAINDHLFNLTVGKEYRVVNVRANGEGLVEVINDKGYLIGYYAERFKLSPLQLARTQMYNWIK